MSHVSASPADQYFPALLWPFILLYLAPFSLDMTSVSPYLSGNLTLGVIKDNSHCP